MPENCIGRIFGMVTFAAIIAVSAWLFVYYFGDRDSLPDALPQLPNASDIEDFLPDIELFHREDPFSKANPEDANKWSTPGNVGLELTLINSLDDMWYTYFDVAIQEWDAGTPDALTLATEMGQPEPECSPVDGVMKVCNGDYGETDWKGINTVLIESGWITTSSAKMNDHFFAAGADENKRQYTMCHEIGHGFGLPHTDEEFWNRDLGNCLDYTNNFEGNKSPDEFLYRFLADLYGTVDGLPWDSNSTDTAEGGGGDATGTAVDSSSPWNPFGWGNGGRRRNRVLRTSGSSVSSNSRESRRLFSSVQDETRRQALLSQWAEINASIMNGSSGSERQGWRLLHQSEFGVSHEMQLDDDFTVQIHKLLA